MPKAIIISSIVGFFVGLLFDMGWGHHYYWAGGISTGFILAWFFLIV